MDLAPCFCYPPPMNLHLKQRMTVEEFHAWCEARRAALAHDEPKWELFDGVAEMQESERWIHVQTKLSIMLAIRSAIARAGFPLETGFDGLGVRISPKESYVPEVVVFPAGEIGDDDRYAPNPLIVVEVLSPSTANKDLVIKAAGYGRVPSILHYLVADPDAREIPHFTREGDKLVEPASASTTGVLRLDPPRLEIALADCFSK